MSGRGPGALVLGDDYRALGVARSLGRRGVPVWLVADRAEGPTQYSRFCRARFPWLTSSAAARGDRLAELAMDDRLAGSVVFPTDDASAELVARNHERLAERFRLTTQHWPELRRALDKRLANDAAQEAGVEVPRTWTAISVEELEDADVVFPAILKPAIKQSENDLTTAKAWRVDSWEELRKAFLAAARLVNVSSILVQELIPGGGECQLSFAALCEDGRPLVSLVARRTRQYPIDFGHSSTFVEVIEDPSVEDAGRRLLRTLRFSGLVEVELKRDRRDGRLVLLDVNPRLWTWHMLGGHAGIDFPYLAWRQACGLPVAAARARLGACWMRFAADAPASVALWSNGELGLRGYASSLFRRKARAVLAFDDPLPALADLPLLVRRARTTGDDRTATPSFVANASSRL